MIYSALLFVIGLSFSFLEHCDIVTFDPLLWWNIQREDQFWTRKGVNTRIYNVQAQQNLADVVHSITFWAMYCNKCKRVPLRSFILSHFLPSYLNRGSLPNEKNSYYSMIFLHQKIYASKLFQKFNVCFWIAKLRKPHRVLVTFLRFICKFEVYYKPIYADATELMYERCCQTW